MVSVVGDKADLTYYPPVRTVAFLAVWSIILAACASGAEPTPTTGTGQSTTTVAPAPTTTNAVTTTSPAVHEPVTEVSALPVDTGCVLDDVPTGGEATVLSGGRLYGLGADWLTPRCLVDGVVGSDFDWGPMGDRIRVGTRVIDGADEHALADAEQYEWTGPTGSRVVTVTSGNVAKIDIADGSVVDITFLDATEGLAYHPAGTHVLALGTDFNGQYGLWLASNEGADPVLLAFDEGATMSEPVWSWLGEPLFVAHHFDGTWHIHRVELTEEGALEGPIVVESTRAIDMLTPARHDPVMLAYRLDGSTGSRCVDGSRATVNGADLPEPLASLTTTPIGWLSTERLLIMAFPDGCDLPGDLWSFSAGLCPGSVYGAELVIQGVDWAAARETAPQPPPSPDFTGIIDPAPA
jgi:hypothetical protein